MSPNELGLLCGTLFLCTVLAISWWQRLARRRFLAALQSMAEGRNEIGGHSAEHWLSLVNRNSEQLLIAIDTMVLNYQQRDWLILNGGIMFCTVRSCSTVDGFFVIAIGQLEVKLLAEQADVFRLIRGSSDLALFSIYRRARFLRMLREDGGVPPSTAAGAGVRNRI